MTDFFEPTEHKEQWQEIYQNISEIIFKGGKARHIVEYLHKAQKFLQPSVPQKHVVADCQHAHTEMNDACTYVKCTDCGKIL